MECILAAGLLAGGTGVTAMVNLATVILKNPADKVKVRAQHLLEWAYSLSLLASDCL